MRIKWRINRRLATFVLLALMGSGPIGLSASANESCLQGVLKKVVPEWGTAVQFGGFARPVTTPEIVSINRHFGGSTMLTGDLTSSYAAAARERGFYGKAAALIRGIAGRHLFDNGNKRTAQVVYELLLKRNHIPSAITEREIRKVIDRVARGELRDVSQISDQLRGFQVAPRNIRRIMATHPASP